MGPTEQTFFIASNERTPVQHGCIALWFKLAYSSN
ncbi:unnamed protein product [Coffea canephora]|uniref:DH200=94 genomic scaffold, scaffold_3530 n=1 Tax=Coffea canephora TaxID=49390 RepID=A0A068VKK0_COFCA|nr:unnamed protein product [Coffea canephora]